MPFSTMEDGVWGRAPLSRWMCDDRIPMLYDGTGTQSPVNGIWGPSDVLAINDSNDGFITTAICQAADFNLVGISLSGHRDLSGDQGGFYIGKLPTINPAAANYRTNLTPYARMGELYVRQANDTTEIQIGDIMQAVTDTIAIEGIAAQVVGAEDNYAWEVITTGGSLVDDTDIINLHDDISQCVGQSQEHDAARNVVNLDDNRLLTWLLLQPFRQLTSA